MDTNAIASAVLSLQLLMPAFNQFAQRAELDVSLPLEEARVTKTNASRTQPSFTAVFDHRHQFNWLSSIQDPHKGILSYYDLEQSRPFRQPGYTRELLAKRPLISTNEAKAIAERCLTNLSVNLKKMKARPPLVGQYVFQENAGDPSSPLPVFGVRWFKKGSNKPEWYDRLVEIEISGLTKKITRFSASPQALDGYSIDLRQFMTNRTEKIRHPR